MEGLTRYDVAVYKGVAMVVVESDLLPPDPAVVVIPLPRDYPAVKGLKNNRPLSANRESAADVFWGKRDAAPEKESGGFELGREV